MTSRTASRRNRATSSPSTSAARSPWVVPAAVIAVLGILAGLYAIYRTSAAGDERSGAGRHEFQVGDPGPGRPAPNFTLTASTGKQISLADYRGRTVLLYFQEGIGCQPCWDQIRDLERAKDKLTAAGVDQVLSITTNDIGDITRKTKDDGLSTPVLSDPDLTVSHAYQANQYGMMGDSRDGHTFLLVGPDGRITWRADYGGAPNYTMYVPVDDLLADLRQGART